MPSKSKAQRNFMAAAAHNPKFAKKVGVPVSVAKEFNQADKGKKFKEGGIMKDKMKAVAKKEVKGHEARMHGKKDDEMKMKKGGSCGMKKYAKGGGIEVRGKTKGRMV